MPNIGQFVLHSKANPPLKAGDYVLQGRQAIAGGQTEPYDGHVRVTAPRYALPADQLLSTFPPANSEGAYENRLPQVVLKRRTLPWERAPKLGEDDTPWLALVVIAEGEGTLSGDTPIAQCVTPGVALDRAQRRRHRDLPVGLADRRQQGLPHRGRPAAALPRARGRRPRHRAGQRRRRRLPGRGHGQPPAAVRPHRRQARPLPGVPHQHRGPARRPAQADRRLRRAVPGHRARLRRPLRGGGRRAGRHRPLCDGRRGRRGPVRRRSAPPAAGTPRRGRCRPRTATRGGSPPSRRRPPRARPPPRSGRRRRPASSRRR